MPLYSFRTECQSDIDSLTELLRLRGISHFLRVVPDAIVPDRYMQMESDADIEQIRDAMREVVDGHVMLQTLRPCALAQNSLSRDYDLV
jgi:nitrogen regulatory protein PII-like uncharacterized protein